MSNMPKRQFTRIEVANMQAGMESRDVWTTQYVNDLPDSAFLLVYTDAKGTKQRMFPYKDSSGKIDVPHLKNALARIPQASTLSADQRASAMTKAKRLAAAHPDIGGGTTSQYQGTAGSGRSRSVPTELLVDQTRTFSLIMELREHGDGRTLYGRAVPYNVTTDIGRDRERFVPGAFSRQLSMSPPEHVKLYDAHSNRIDGRMPVGKTTRLTEQPDGLYGEWRMFDTSAGEDALKLVKAGEVTGLSIGFRSASNGSARTDDGVIERRSAHLDHVALTHEPQYQDATVLAVRAIVRLPDYDADRERLRELVIG